MTAAARTFTGVTPELARRVKALAFADHGVVFDPPDASSTTATARTPLGDCVIALVHDEERAELRLTLVRKPLLLPETALWSAFEAALDRCRRESAS